jgi:hypothetical protein
LSSFGDPDRHRSGSRARSSSVFHEESARRRTEEICNRRRQATRRLKSAWELIHEKYKDVAPEDDDEIDITTLEVTEYRGHLLEHFRKNRSRWEEWQEDDQEDDAMAGTSEWGSDEDELGAWEDDRSGLDDQEVERVMQDPWDEANEFDRQDRDAFLQEEAERRAMMGLDAQRYEDISEDAFGSESGSADGSSEDDDHIDIPGRKTSSAMAAELETLSFLDVDLEDELLARTSDAEEADRVVYVDNLVSCCAPLMNTNQADKAGDQRCR